MWALGNKINLVLSQNSWYEPYAYQLHEQLKKKGFDVKVLFSHQDVEKSSIVFFLSYQKIVPVHDIDRCFRALVVHASDLPKGKGFSPWVWQILEGKNCIPLCLFKMEEVLDAGPIFLKDFLNLSGTELLPEIRYLLAEKINDLVLKYLTDNNEPQGISQKGEESMYRKRSAKDSELSLHKNLEEQFNLLRVVDNENYPAYFMYQGKKYILKISEENNAI